VTVLRIALAQINPIVGDLAGNEAKIAAYIARAREAGADLVAFPELTVTGYPPEDLLLKPGFVAANLACLRCIAKTTAGITAIVGFVDRTPAGDLYNAAAVLHDGQVAAIYHKIYLPNYGVFDEDRYFGAADRPLLVSLGEAMIGVSICEDIWYPSGPVEAEALAGAQLAINISASPYHAGKGPIRERMLATRAADNVLFVAFCNLVGGQDELVFDGGSVVLDERGEPVARAQSFVEDLVLADLDLSAVFRQRLHDPRLRKERARQSAEGVEQVAVAPLPHSHRPAIAARLAPYPEPLEEVLQALVLGSHDYVRKNGFREVVVALSGGIDSALTAVVAVEALGCENVTGVFMPTRYSSEDSRADAAQLAENLRIRYLTVPIDGIFQAYLDTLAGPFAGRQPDIAEENVQARIRGNILMALSHKFGWLVLTTGNKSEMSVGYATLYGDMAGGLAVLKDVPKMLVYDLARRINARAGHSVIPQRIIDKAPTAELRPNQKDEDSLPPYCLLDPILHAYVEEDLSLEEIVALGYDRAMVSDVIRMVDRAEYKRRQAAPGPRITSRALGRDRRLPITNRFRKQNRVGQ
jgi:NAD+ synthase (glutamine-hydrolysing)